MLQIEAPAAKPLESRGEGGAWTGPDTLARFGGQDVAALGVTILAAMRDHSFPAGPAVKAATAVESMSGLSPPGANPLDTSPVAAGKGHSGSWVSAALSQPGAAALLKHSSSGSACVLRARRRECHQRIPRWCPDLGNKVILVWLHLGNAGVTGAV